MDVLPCPAPTPPFPVVFPHLSDHFCLLALKMKAARAKMTKHKAATARPMPTAILLTRLLHRLPWYQ